MQPLLPDEAARRLASRRLEHAGEMKPAQRGGRGKFLDGDFFREVGLNVIDNALEAPGVKPPRSARRRKRIEVQTRIVVEEPDREGVSQRFDENISAGRLELQFTEYFPGDDLDERIVE